MPLCPNGHQTRATDYCDVCGSPITLVADQPNDGGPRIPFPPAADASGPFPAPQPRPSAWPTGQPSYPGRSQAGYGYQSPYGGAYGQQPAFPQRPVSPYGSPYPGAQYPPQQFPSGYRGVPYPQPQYPSTPQYPSAGFPAPKPPVNPPQPEAPTPSPAPEKKVVLACPNCGETAPAGSLFCEGCGYDYTTGALPLTVGKPKKPAPVTPAPVVPTESTPGTTSKPEPVVAEEPEPVAPAEPESEVATQPEPVDSNEPEVVLEDADPAQSSDSPEPDTEEIVDAELVDPEEPDPTQDPDNSEATVSEPDPAETSETPSEIDDSTQPADLVPDLEAVPLPDAEPASLDLDAIDLPAPKTQSADLEALPTPEPAPSQIDLSAVDVPKAPPVSLDLDPVAPAPEPAPAPTESNSAPSRSVRISSAPSVPTSWVAEMWIDPDWYQDQSSQDEIPSPGLPRVVQLLRTTTIGRPSPKRGYFPVIDCDPDTGVSREHAILSTDGSRWFIEDVGSSNGTFLGRVDTLLPEQPIRGRREVTPDDRIDLGTWTRIVIRPGLPEEIQAPAVPGKMPTN